MGAQVWCGLQERRRCKSATPPRWVPARGHPRAGSKQRASASLWHHKDLTRQLVIEVFSFEYSQYIYDNGHFDTNDNGA